MRKHCDRSNHELKLFVWHGISNASTNNVPGTKVCARRKIDQEERSETWLRGIGIPFQLEVG